MTPVVVDANVVIKWYVPEIYTAEAQRLQDEAYDLQAPDLLSAEFGNILWKKIVHRGELTEREAVEIITSFQIAPIKLYASFHLLPTAFQIAVATKRTIYDCLYLALAQAQSCRLVTADEKFYNALTGTVYHASLIWVGDL